MKWVEKSKRQLQIQKRDNFWSKSKPDSFNVLPEVEPSNNSCWTSSMNSYFTKSSSEIFCNKLILFKLKTDTACFGIKSSESCENPEIAVKMASDVRSDFMKLL